jgi:hypothetical protein
MRFWAVLEAADGFLPRTPDWGWTVRICGGNGFAFLRRLGIVPTVRHADYSVAWLSLWQGEHNRSNREVSIM